MARDTFESELDVLVDCQERGPSDLGQQLSNFKKLVVLLFELRARFDSMEAFCEEAAASGLGRVEEMLFSLESALGSFHDIKSALASGADSSKHSRDKIKAVLASGSLRLFRKSGGRFEFRVRLEKDTLPSGLRVLAGEEGLLDPNEFASLYSFAELRASRRSGRLEQCVSDFFGIFSRVRTLTRRLDHMIDQGLSPDESLLRGFGLAQRADELDRRIDAAKTQLAEWAQYTARLFENCDTTETFFLQSFKGPDLVELSPSNLAHYLRLFSRDMRLEWVGPQAHAQTAGLGSSRAKIEYLRRLFGKNRETIERSVLSGVKRRLFTRNQLNYVHVREDRSHQLLLHLFASRLGEKLECSKLLFCCESTAWETIQCTCAITGRLHLPQRAGPQSEHVLRLERHAPSGAAGKAHVCRVLEAGQAEQAVQRAVLRGPQLRRRLVRQLQVQLSTARLRSEGQLRGPSILPGLRR